MLRGGGGRGGEGICPYIIYTDGVGVIFRFFVYLMLWGGGGGEGYGVVLGCLIDVALIVFFVLRIQLYLLISLMLFMQLSLLRSVLPVSCC